MILGLESYKSEDLEELRVSSLEESLDLSLSILEGRTHQGQGQGQTKLKNKKSKIISECIAMNTALSHSMLSPQDDLKTSTKICLDALYSGQASNLLKKWLKKQ